jgi:proliferating cell nuclear antigen
MRIIDIELEDIHEFRTLIEILNGFVSEANTDFIKDHEQYSKKMANPATGGEKESDGDNMKNLSKKKQLDNMAKQTDVSSVAESKDKISNGKNKVEKITESKDESKKKSLKNKEPSEDEEDEIEEVDKKKATKNKLKKKTSKNEDSDEEEDTELKKKLKKNIKKDDDLSDNDESEQNMKLKKKVGKKKVSSEIKKSKNYDEQEEDNDESTSQKETTKPKKEVNNGQIKIITTDSNQILMSFIVLKASGFKKFEVLPDEYKVGLNIDELFKYMKNADKDGTMEIYIDNEDSQNIMFNVMSPQSSKISKCELKVLNLTERKKKQIEADFSMAVRIPCTEFHKTCKDLSQFSTLVEILCDPDKLTITCKGDMSTHSRTFKSDGSENGAVIKCIKKDGNKPDIVRLIFELKYINMMYKCMNLCKDMEIYLKANNVMFLKYGIGLEGTMLVGIAPAPSKEKVPTNINYDEDLDKFYEDEEINLK